MGLFDKLFGKKEETFDPNHIFAPMAGQTVPVAEVPDPTFAQGVLGEGIAIIFRLLFFLQRTIGY